MLSILGISKFLEEIWWNQFLKIRYFIKGYPKTQSPYTYAGVGWYPEGGLAKKFLGEILITKLIKLDPIGPWAAGR